MHRCSLQSETKADDTSSTLAAIHHTRSHSAIGAVRLGSASLWLIDDGHCNQNYQAKHSSWALLTLCGSWAIRHKWHPILPHPIYCFQPSDTEGISGVILEAGLLSLPVVATNVGGVAECVLDGKTGILLDPQNEIGFAEAVISLLQKPESCSEMGRQACQWVTAHFTMDQIAQQYLTFYTNVLKKCAFTIGEFEQKDKTRILDYRYV